MTDDPCLSPLRNLLCSHANAVRVARWMRRAAIDTAIVPTGDLLQPWRIVEATVTDQEIHACA